MSSNGGHFFVSITDKLGAPADHDEGCDTIGGLCVDQLSKGGGVNDRACRPLAPYSFGVQAQQDVLHRCAG